MVQGQRFSGKRSRTLRMGTQIQKRKPYANGQLRQKATTNMIRIYIICYNEETRGESNK